MYPNKRSFVLAVIVVIPYIGLLIWLTSSLRIDSIRHFHKLTNPTFGRKHYVTENLRLLAKELSETQRSLQHSQLHFYRLEKHIQLVKELIISTDGNLTDDLKKKQFSGQFFRKLFAKERFRQIFPFCGGGKKKNKKQRHFMTGLPQVSL